MSEHLRRWLALEHEAVWLYGLIGGRFDDLRGLAESAWQHHRAGRDHLSMTIRTAGATPVGPAMSYARPVTTEAEARAAARDVELRVAAAALAALAASARRADRRFAISRTRAAARAAISWGAEPQAFPGLASSP